MKPGGASISLPTSQALLCTSRVQVDGKGSGQLDGRDGELCREPTTNNHGPCSQTSWTDTALSGITSDTPLRAPNGEDLRAVAAAVSALSSPAPPTGDGEQVSASTQNQALAALLFLYRDLLEREMELDGVVRARTRQRVPVVLSEGEVRAVRERLEGEPALVVGLLYGSGLRLMEALRLRVKDLDFQRRELAVRDGKGGKDRLTMVPQSLVPGLQEHLEQVRQLHRSDLAAG